MSALRKSHAQALNAQRTVQTALETDLQRMRGALRFGGRRPLLILVFAQRA